MEQKGKFVLMILDEFGPFLDAAVVHRAIHLVQNHHTFIPNYSHFTGANHFKLLEGMERAHLERGFAEIAQNLTIFPDGRVAVCRSLDKIPAGIKGANGGGICIENVGDFDTGKDQMTDEQRDTIVAVNAMLCRRFSLTPDADSIVYHHWFDLDSGQRTNGTGITKSCPGTGFFGGNRVPDAVGGLIPRIVAVMNGAAPPPPPPIVPGARHSRLPQCAARAGGPTCRSEPPYQGNARPRIRRERQLGAHRSGQPALGQQPLFREGLMLNFRQRPRPRE